MIELHYMYQFHTYTRGGIVKVIGLTFTIFFYENCHHYINRNVIHFGGIEKSIIAINELNHFSLIKILNFII